MKGSLFTYRVALDGETYRYIGFYRWAIVLSKINMRQAQCGECGNNFEAGKCIYHKQHYHNFFICLPCAKMMIHKYGSKGFGVSVLMNLQAMDSQTGRYTARQVADSLKLFHVKRDESGIENLEEAQYA